NYQFFSMRNSRIIRLVRLLSAAELRKFVQFVESPFFNQNEKLLKMARIIHESAPDFGEASLKKERVFKLIYGEAAVYEEQKIHDLVSLLHRLFEKYLTIQQIEKDPITQNRYLLTALADRNEGDHFKRVYKSTLKKLGQKKHEIPMYHLQEFLLEEQVAVFAQKNGKYKEANTSLGKLVKELDIFYLVERLKYVIEKINRQQALQSSPETEEFDFFHQMIKELDRDMVLKVPIVKIYLQVYLMLTDFEVEIYFTDLISLLDTHAEEISPHELFAVYSQAQNYCIKKVNSGKREFLESLFAIYQSMLDRGLLIRNGFMHQHVYKNITSNALYLQKYEWTLEFLNTYKRKLPPDQQENAYAYNLANYHYEQKEYREAMQLLLQVDFPNWRYHLGTKSMLLRIYYELRDEDGLNYLIQALKVYLHRHKEIPKYQSQNHLNLMRFSQKALLLHTNKPFIKSSEFYKRIIKLRDKVTSTPGIAYGGWLQQKVKELEELIPQENVPANS
ncbi:MAG: hypothetical protein AAGC85_18540, partial [Bacteroidota bacterium]